jgi:hypothetical protein
MPHSSPVQPLPRAWPQSVQAAILQVIALAQHPTSTCSQPINEFNHD